jgi:hypothetical protein
MRVLKRCRSRKQARVHGSESACAKARVCVFDTMESGQRAGGAGLNLIPRHNLGHHYQGLAELCVLPRSHTVPHSLSRRE